MRTGTRIIAYALRDAARSRWLLAYAGFFLLATDALLRFGDGGAKGLLGLVNVVLLVVPLVSVVFGAMYLYNAREFTELLLAQPVSRRQLYAGIYLGLTLPFSAAFAVGVAIPAAVEGPGASGERGTLAALVGTGVALTFVFTALAFLIALRAEDKVRGLGAAIALWLGVTLLYDGLVLILVLLLGDHPIEKPMLAAMLSNPVDLARVLLLFRFDVSALMGYTGAVFKSFFGGTLGTAVAVGALTLWIGGPVLLGARWFQRKDF